MEIIWKWYQHSISIHDNNEIWSFDESFVFGKSFCGLNDVFR